MDFLWVASRAVGGVRVGFPAPLFTGWIVRLTYAIRYTAFPNNEHRLVAYRPAAKRVSSESQRENGSSADQGSSPYLTLSKNSDRHTNCHSQEESVKPGYGASGKCPGYSLNARRRILRAGGAIDRVVTTPSDCLFLTGTLPGSTEEAKRAIAEWSGYAVNLVQSWLGKRIPDKLLIYAWEFQKRGALHLHLTVVCMDSAIRTEILSEWKAQWTRVIDNISLKSGVDCWRKNKDYTHANGNKNTLQTDAQVCTKSAAAYLSKYMSKENLNSNYITARNYHPSRYWGVSRPLCALIEELTDRYEVEISKKGEMLGLYEDCLSEMAWYEGKGYAYEHKESQTKVAVKYTSTEDFESCQNSIKSAIRSSQNFYFLNGKMGHTDPLSRLRSCLVKVRESCSDMSVSIWSIEWFSAHWARVVSCLEHSAMSSREAMISAIHVSDYLLNTGFVQKLSITLRAGIKESVKRVKKELEKMQPIKLKSQKVKVEQETIEVPVPLNPAMTPDDEKYEEWKLRSDITASIRLAVGFMKKRRRFMDAFENLNGTGIRLGTFATVGVSCTLKTGTLIDIANRIYATMATIPTGVNNQDDAVKAAIVSSIKAAYDSEYLRQKIGDGSYKAIV